MFMQKTQTNYDDKSFDTEGRFFCYIRYFI